MVEVFVQEESKEDVDSCVSGVTNKTKSGGVALSKHCTVDGCEGKLITGRNWARHGNEKHKGLVP